MYVTLSDSEKSLSFDNTVEISSHACCNSHSAAVNMRYNSSCVVVTQAGFKQQSDIQGHRRSLVWVPLDRPHMMDKSSLASMSLSCTTRVVPKVLGLVYKETQSNNQFIFLNNLCEL